MPKPKRLTKPIHTLARPCVSLPIIYHDGLGDLHWESKSVGWSVGRLRKAGEKAIRTRHREAFIEHESHKAHPSPFYCLTLSRTRSVRTYFTVEQHSIVIRGYAWDVTGEPKDEYDGGVVCW